MPEVEYDWELKKLTIDGEQWKSYLQDGQQIKNIA